MTTQESCALAFAWSARSVPFMFHTCGAGQRYHVNLIAIELEKVLYWCLCSCCHFLIVVFIIHRWGSFIAGTSTQLVNSTPWFGQTFLARKLINSRTTAVYARIFDRWQIVIIVCVRICLCLPMFGYNSVFESHGTCIKLWNVLNCHFCRLQKVWAKWVKRVPTHLQKTYCISSNFLSGQGSEKKRHIGSRLAS